MTLCDSELITSTAGNVVLDSAAGLDTNQPISAGGTVTMTGDGATTIDSTVTTTTGNMALTSVTSL